MKSILYVIALMFCVNASGQVQFMFYVIPPSCDGCEDASIDITIAGCLTGAYSYTWYGPQGFTDVNEDLDGLPAGEYGLSVSDADGTEATAVVTIPATGPPFTQTENLMIDCLSGGGWGVLLRCIYFPPSDPDELGEACILPPGCVDPPITFEWYDSNDDLVSYFDCMEEVASGVYTVIVTDNMNQSASMVVDMTEGADFGMMSTEEFCEPTAIHESMEAPHLSIVPNPSDGHFLLSCEDCGTRSNYILYDQRGQVFMKSPVRGNHTYIEMDGARAGIYQVMLIDPEGIQSHLGRIMVTR